VSGLYGKISNPVLTNLKLSATNDIKFSEVYPPELPDLFHGSQLVVLGRYSGHGPAAVKLSGRIGMESKEFVYELTFAAKTGEDREFVEHLWARRKVGYLLDQIRANGEKKELVQEVIALAKKYGITTPYTRAKSSKPNPSFGRGLISARERRMILPAFARFTEEKHAPLFAADVVARSPFRWLGRPPAVPPPPPPTARHHRHRHLRRDLWL
jgi:hypothetical protein